ncbi:ATP-binding cassette domain-containing protein [Clostridium haemolyticum]|uniref:ATP-binding cassette domain-containing protein n=1 Tax=Clostridium haemolyticum TaxID=84025 RepID=UPI0023DD83BB|nr:ATP-binding cassette domain-containing protein [Clostridium haemolyticum]
MLKIQHLHKKLGDFKLTDINLEIEKGEYFVILGPTGTGKSIVLETLAGLYKPDEGKIYFNEVDLTNEYPENREIGFVYQDYVLFPHLSVKNNIIFGLKQKKDS